MLVVANEKGKISFSMCDSPNIAFVHRQQSKIIMFFIISGGSVFSRYTHQMQIIWKFS